MKLAAYLQANNLTDTDFARQINVGKQTIGRYRTGERIPTNRIMIKIYKATGGKVTAHDFMYMSMRRVC